MENLIKYEHVHSLIQHQKFQDASDFLFILLYTKPDEPLWYGLRLIIASENRRGHEVIFWHNMITTLFPGSVHAKIAEALIPGNKILNAIKNLQVALAMDGNNPYIHYLLGNFFRMQNDYLKALRCYDRCLTIDKEFLLAYPFRMHCFNQIGDDNSALLDFVNIITKSPEINNNLLKENMLENFRRLEKQNIFPFNLRMK